jgi:hypothetical protein
LQAKKGKAAPAAALIRNCYSFHREHERVSYGHVEALPVLQGTVNVDAVVLNLSILAIIVPKGIATHNSAVGNAWHTLFHV